MGGGRDKQDARLAKDLAAKLNGVSPAQVQKALGQVRDERMAKRRKEEASAIAAELDGVSTSDVEKALAKVEAKHESAERSGDRGSFRRGGPRGDGFAADLASELHKSTADVQKALKAASKKQFDRASTSGQRTAASPRSRPIRSRRTARTAHPASAAATASAAAPGSTGSSTAPAAGPPAEARAPAASAAPAKRRPRHRLLNGPPARGRRAPGSNSPNAQWPAPAHCPLPTQATPSNHAARHSCRRRATVSHMLHRTTSLLNKQVSIDVRDPGFTRGAATACSAGFTTSTRPHARTAGAPLARARRG